MIDTDRIQLIPLITNALSQRPELAFHYEEHRIETEAPLPVINFVADDVFQPTANQANAIQKARYNFAVIKSGSYLEAVKNSIIATLETVNTGSNKTICDVTTKTFQPVGSIVDHLGVTFYVVYQS